MLLGSHLSVAGSMAKALREAESLGLDTVQVFTKNQQQWRVPPINEDARKEWLDELGRLGWRDRTVSHASYLINLASPDDELWRKSVDLMTVEIERCAALSIPLLVHHPGAFTSSSLDAGLGRIAKAYEEVFRRTSGAGVVSCLENTVGEGSTIGRTPDELARLAAMIDEATGAPERLGFCFDTCHAHAGGHDMSTAAGAAAVLGEFERACGAGRIRVLHLNDSKAAAGSRLDRHEHIGSGTIGSGPFGSVINRPSLAGVPMILETPKGTTPKGTALDTLNIRRLRKLQSVRGAGSGAAGRADEGGTKKRGRARA